MVETPVPISGIPDINSIVPSELPFSEIADGKPPVTCCIQATPIPGLFAFFFKKSVIFAKNPRYQSFFTVFVFELACDSRNFCTSAWMNFGQLLSLLNSPLFVPVLVVAYFTISILAAVAFFLLKKAAGFRDLVRSTASPFTRTFFFQNAWNAVKILFLSYLAVITAHEAPEFIYKAF